MKRRRYCTAVGAAVAAVSGGCLRLQEGEGAADPGADGRTGSGEVMEDRRDDGSSADDGRYGRLYAYDAEDGDVRWTHDTLANGLEWMIGAIGATDDTVYYGASGGGSSRELGPIVRALDAGSGDPLWEREFDEGSIEHLSAHGDVLYVGNTFDAYRLDASTGELVAEETHGVYPQGTASADGLVYPAFRTARAFDPASGETIWETELERTAETAAAFSEGTLYFGTEAGYVTALDADDGSVAWDVQLPNVPDRRPVVGDRVVWVTTDADRIYALRRSDGARLAEYDPDSHAILRGVGSRVRVPFGEADTVYEVLPDAVADGEVELRPAWTVPKGTAINVTADGRFVGRAGTSITAVSADGQRVWSGEFERGFQPMFWDGRGYASNGRSVLVGFSSPVQRE